MAFADKKINVTEKWSVLRRVENIVGKGKKCWCPALSPFPTFSKAFFVKVNIVWYRVKIGKCSVNNV